MSFSYTVTFTLKHTSSGSGGSQVLHTERAPDSSSPANPAQKPSLSTPAHPPYEHRPFPNPCAQSPQPPDIAAPPPSPTCPPPPPLDITGKRERTRNFYIFCFPVPDTQQSLNKLFRTNSIIMTLTAYTFSSAAGEKLLRITFADRVIKPPSPLSSSYRANISFSTWSAPTPETKGGP